MPVSRALQPSEPRTAAPTAAREAAARPAPPVSAFSQPLVRLLTAMAIVVLVVVAIQTARSSDLIVGLWAASGLAVAVWLRGGRGLGYDLSFGGLMAMGILFGEVLAGNSPAMAAMFTAANMLEIVLAVLLARRFAPTLNLASVTGAVRFIFVSAAIAPIPSAVLAAGVLAVVRDASFLEGFQTWWFGHALGLAVITPFILSLNAKHLTALRDPWRLAEAGLLFGLLITACSVIFLVLSVQLGFLMIPVMILIAARMRVLGITAALTIISVFAVAGIMNGTGPYQIGANTVAERVLLAQLTIVFGYLPILLVASLLEERDRLSERARAGQARAERASAAKSRLLANVAHEIKSPVGGVIGIGELWATGQLGPTTPTQREMAEMMVKTARQVEALAHDLLDVARAESGAVKVDLRPTDVPGLIEDVRRSTALRPEAERLRLEVVCEGDGLVALADSQRLVQVLDNLATNAVKYGGSGGIVTFRAYRIYDGVRIEVTDRGPGLSVEKQAQLFEPFNRLGLERSSVEGHGIGLALSKRLVELQGGTIGVTSAQGEGATFWVELPAA
jgi:signal transduction histidine kinase